MKPPERCPPEDAGQWLDRARSHLARAKTRFPGVYLEDSCFDAQQAAERAVKAVMFGRGVAFPHIPDLARLLSILEADGEQIPAEVRKVSKLTSYAMQSRYPNLEEAVSEEEYSETIAIAEAVVAWAEKRL
ncbi:MAG: HEPN domain-containing protein [Acidobacteria bacterium]|nr:HEPN domain-containing protein [Acidobacteriota bacterium]MYA47428.1 HEPN domain-containing protein [Acidobacteriota bacterium]MYI39804.1 HEPN domain-containing protein [Acidobacteriota bacterium]